jgi:uncharacterized protein (TIGR03086 family)
MTSTIDRYTADADPFTTVVTSLPHDAWDAPSPCEGWSARDVLDHVVATQREFLSGHGLDVGPPPDLHADPVAGWSAHSETVRAWVCDDAVMARGYDGFFGPTTIGATLLDFYGFDLLVHRWDIASAADLDERFTSSELDRIDASADAFGPGLYMEGVCKPAVEVPGDADRQTRVLALLGRRA